MDRRDFLKFGAAGVAGAALGSVADLSWLADTASAEERAGRPWKFGVMADTQWQKNVDGLNPGTCAVGVVNLVNAEFVKHGVDFVIQVGDLIDQETDAANGNPSARTLPVRAQAAQALYDAGIGFFPLRGNHEGSALAANEFVTLYPQARGVGSHVYDAVNFSSPFAGLNGLSYSFDFNNIRFVLIDQFTRVDGTNSIGGTDGNTLDQLAWIESRLSSRAKSTHAFVLGHKNLIGQNHVDTLLGADPHANAGQRNEFIGALQANGVRYYIGGHDHNHRRSQITSPDGKSAVKQLIAASDSYKFYTPANPANDATYDKPSTLELGFAEELYTFGYYIFTVDGPRLTVDFYSSTPGVPYNAVPFGLTVSPSNTYFYKRDSWGYSLNGREFIVAEGGSLAAVADTWKGTHAAILGGTNGSTRTDIALRKLSKAVNTGWSHPESRKVDAASQVLTLWGLQDNVALWDATQTALLPAVDSSWQTDTYALSLSYDPMAVRHVNVGNGNFGIAARNTHGKWINAVDLNFGGTKKFVNGPWKASYPLGYYGCDQKTKTVWAVVNHQGDFVVDKKLTHAAGGRRRR